MPAESVFPCRPHHSLASSAPTVGLWNWIFAERRILSNITKFVYCRNCSVGTCGTQNEMLSRLCAHSHYTKLPADTGKYRQHLAGRRGRSIKALLQQVRPAGQLWSVFLVGVAGT